MSHNGQPPGHSEQSLRHGWARILDLGPKWITAIAALLAALGGIGFFAGRATTTPQKNVAMPAQTVTTTVTASPATITTTGGAWTIYYQTSVGISGSGLNFDNNLPSSASADIYYNGSLASTSTAILAVWQGSDAPTPAKCDNWVTTHPSGSVYPVTVGMQICLKTAEGRLGILYIQNITSDAANGQITVWQSRS
jgi:hypothetical protein